MKITKLYHLHTNACHHATITLQETIDYAIQHGYTKLVFTEHYPYHDSKIEDEWTTQDSFNNFYTQFVEAREKYKNQIEIYFGCETEYPRFEREYFNSIKNDKRVQFAIFGNHRYEKIFMKNSKNETFADVIAKYNKNKKNPTTNSDLKNYYKLTKEAFKSGMFSYFAHPDVWINRWGKWDRKAIRISKKLIKLAIKHNMVLGFNGYGVLKKEKKGIDIAYPFKPFWELVSKFKNAKVLIEADSHELKCITEEHLDRLVSLALDCNLANNIVEDVELKLFN